MVVTGDEIGAWVGHFLWPFIRVSALFLSAPVFGSRSLPLRLRIIIVSIITLYIAPLIPSVPIVDALSITALLIALQQVLIGITMGIILQIVFSMLVMAGEQMAYSMGLGFASMVDPQNGVSVPVISQFFIVIATLLYLAIDGHAAIIKVLVGSFFALPIEPIGVSGDQLWQVISWASMMFIGAVHIALPIVASLLMVYLSLGIMTRVAPQLNIFSVGFPLTMLMGFITIMLFMKTFLPVFVSFLERGLSVTRDIMGL